MEFIRYKKYTKIISQYFSASLVPMLLNLAINPLVSLAMEPEDFAITGYYSSFSTLISPIIIFYMLHYYNKRYFELDEEGQLHLRALLFKSLIFFSFIVAFVCLVALVIFIRTSTSNSFPIFPYLPLVVFSIPLTGIYSLELADYKMKRNSKSYMKFSISKGLLGVFCTLLFVVLLRWRAFGKLLGPLVVELLFFTFLLIKHKDLWKIKTKAIELLPILKFCFPLVIGAALGFFSNGYDKTALEKLGNTTEFGYYCVGASIATYLSVFTNSLSATFQPDIYESIIKNNKSKLLKVVSINWVLTFCVVLLFIAFCPIVIRILTANKYIMATKYARIFACMSLTNSIYYVINDYSIARGKPYFYLITTIIGSGLIIYIMPFAIELWDYSGGAFMMVFSYVIMSAINTFLLCFPTLCKKFLSIFTNQ